MAGEGTQPSGMSPLQALILGRMRDKGWTPKQVEERGVSHATLWRYMNPVRLSSPPRKSVMQSLANALDLPVSEVQRAAVESVGYLYAPGPGRLESIPTPDGDPLVAYVQGIDGLTPEMRADLLAKFREAVRQAREQASGG